MSLTSEEKKIWTDALRSGLYPQTKGTLHNLDDGGFCCLGLGALVLGVASAHYMGRSEVIDEDGDSFGLCEGPQEIYEYWEEKLGNWTVMNHLTKMNDSGDTFEEIADWIEEKL